MTKTEMTHHLGPRFEEAVGDPPVTFEAVTNVWLVDQPLAVEKLISAARQKGVDVIGRRLRRRMILARAVRGR